MLLLYHVQQVLKKKHQAIVSLVLFQVMIKSSINTLNRQKGFSSVNSTGGMLLLKYPFPVPQKACSWFHFAKIASLSSPSSVGAERALAVFISWLDWAGACVGWLKRPPNVVCCCCCCCCVLNPPNPSPVPRPVPKPVLVPVVVPKPVPNPKPLFWVLPKNPLNEKLAILS